MISPFTVENSHWATTTRPVSGREKPRRLSFSRTTAFLSQLIDDKSTVKHQTYLIHQEQEQKWQA
jgi:hypothetical protein